MITNIIPPKLFFKSQQINLKKKETELSPIRRNDFIDPSFYTKPDEFTIKNINKFESTTHYNNYNSEDLTTQDWGLAPHKVATMAKKLELNHKSSLIENKYPKIFNGLNKKDIIDGLNTLSFIIRNDSSKEELDINIGEKPFAVSYLGEGCNSKVYKIEDKNQNNVAMKVYKKPDEVNNYSIWGELAVYLATKDSQINNIPELYLSNPIATKVEDSTFEPTELCDVDNIKDYDGEKGAWTIVEYITPDTPPKSYGIGLAEWLENNKLYHLDASCDNLIGNYITDLGGISN